MAATVPAATRAAQGSRQAVEENAACGGREETVRTLPIRLLWSPPTDSAATLPVTPPPTSPPPPTPPGWTLPRAPARASAGVASSTRRRVLTGLTLRDRRRRPRATWVVVRGLQARDELTSAQHQLPPCAARSSRATRPPPPGRWPPSPRRPAGRTSLTNDPVWTRVRAPAPRRRLAADEQRPGQPPPTTWPPGRPAGAGPCSTAARPGPPAHRQHHRARAVHRGAARCSTRRRRRAGSACRTSRPCRARSRASGRRAHGSLLDTQLDDPRVQHRTAATCGRSRPRRCSAPTGRAPTSSPSRTTPRPAARAV